MRFTYTYKVSLSKKEMQLLKKAGKYKYLFYSEDFNSLLLKTLVRKDMEGDISITFLGQKILEKIPR